MVPHPVLGLNFADLANESTRSTASREDARTTFASITPPSSLIEMSTMPCALILRAFACSSFASCGADTSSRGLSHGEAVCLSPPIAEGEMNAASTTKMMAERRRTILRMAKRIVADASALQGNCCNQTWPLKNSFPRNSQKKRVRMPCKRRSRFSWTFSIPQSFDCFEDNGLFQHPHEFSPSTRVGFQWPVQVIFRDNLEGQPHRQPL